MFQNSSIKVQQGTPIYVFRLNFMPICSVTKKCELTLGCPLQKHAPFCPHFAPLWLRAPNF